MSFDKSTFDTSSYDGDYPRTQTDKERIESGKMVPIPNALVQIVNSEDYRFGFHALLNPQAMDHSLWFFSNKNG